MQQRDAVTLSHLVLEFLQRRKLNNGDVKWQIQKSPLGGFGVFAKTDIETGEIVFRDAPIVLGPRASLTCPLICVNCYKKDDLIQCRKNCGLLLCNNNEQCQNSRNHEKECKIIREWTNKDECHQDFTHYLTKVLSPIRALLLSAEDRKLALNLKAHRSDKHGFEVDIMKNLLRFNIKEDDEEFMRLICSIFDSNAFEVIVGNEDNQSSVKGLFSLASLANHSCTPNTTHVFDNDQTMIVRATKFIKKGEEITHSYSRLIWGTQTRRFHLLRTKHFLCKCERCKDATEFGSYMSAIVCKSCKKGNVIAINPLDINTNYKCEICAEIIDKKQFAAVNSLLGSILKSLNNDDLKFMLRCVEDKFKEVVPDNNEATVELKYRIIWILGNKTNYTWTELSEDMLKIKEKYCRDLLSLLEVLRLGQCKMRGLLLYELYRTLGEIKSRGKSAENIAKVGCNEMKSLLAEATEILMDDVSAPEQVKEMWLMQ